MLTADDLLIIRRDAWARTARAQRCVVCNARRPRGHHIITKQALRLYAVSHGYDYGEVEWDLRNLLGLCDRHHAGHHARVRPVTMRELLVAQPEVVSFAKETRLVWWLSRNYPGGGRR